MEAFIFLLYVVPFLLLVYSAFMLYIRPSKSVWVASLLGGLVMGIINLLVDIVAYYSHWWHYTFVQSALDKPNSFQLWLSHIFMGTLNTTHVPLPFYLTPIFMYGSLVYLLIWRFWSGKTRWFSWVLLVGIPLFCIWRDISSGIQQTSYQVWENIPLAAVATAVMWLVAFFLGFLLFWRTGKQNAFVLQTQQSEITNSAKQTPTVSR